MQNHDSFTFAELATAWQALGADSRLYGQIQQQLRQQRSQMQVSAPPIITRPSLFSVEEELSTRFPDFAPSPYQLAIFRFLYEGQGDGIVNAVAGSGKSTTLLYAAQLVQGDVLFASFNSHIADNLKKKIRNKHHTARTLHSIGHGCLTRHFKRQMKIDERKYRSICWKVVAEKLVSTPGQEQRKAVEQLFALSNFARLTLTDEYDTDALLELIAHYALDIDRDLFGAFVDAVPDVLVLGARRAEQQGVIDYTDQIWLPRVFCLEPPQVPWVFVDEAQDLNAAQLALAMKCRAPGGRMLFVGDEKQAIYAFSGADSDSIKHIRQMTQAVDLPLPICYRCPTCHIALAREIVPYIEASPTAQEGIVADVKRVEMPRLVQSGDLVLCRKMAPLVDLCINFIEQRVPAKVRGRDLSHALTDIVHEIEALPDYSGFDDFGFWLGRYEERIVKKLVQREGNEDRIQQIEDRCRAVAACYTGFHSVSADDLCAKIADLFSDERAAVYLSTVHRAKGLEAQRVFILEPENLPLKWEKQKEWEARQEMNLKYVALTRSLEALYFIK